MNDDNKVELKFRTQECPECGTSMGDMPGSRDAVCPSGYKDPCCELILICSRFT